MSRVSHRSRGDNAVPTSTSSNALSPLMNLWILRVLVSLNGYLRWLDPDDFSDSTGCLADALGIHSLEGFGTKRPTRMAVTRHLRQQHALAEKSASRVRLPKALATNCARIAGLIGLDTVSQRILAFTVLLHQNAVLQDATDLLHELNHTRVYSILATLLDIPEPSVCQALAPGTRAGFESAPEMRELRQAVDCLLFVEPMKCNAVDAEPSTRVALALISTLLPKVVNLICCDLADMKQVLRGYVHATLAHIPLTRVQYEGTPVDVADCLHLKTGGAAAHGMFCAYGAPPDDFRLMDFEAIGGAVREIVDSAYPNVDGTFVVAALLDKSLTDTAEVLVCISFDDISIV